MAEYKREALRIDVDLSMESRKDRGQDMKPFSKITKNLPY